MARCVGECAELSRGDLCPDGIQRDGCALGVHQGLEFQRSQFGDSLFERFVFDVGHAALNRVIEPFEPGLGLGGFLAEFRGVRRPAFGTLLAAIKDDAQNLFQPGRIEQSLLQMLGHQIVQPFHGYRAPFTARIALPGRDGTGVVTIAPGFAGANGHGAAAVRAEADAGQHRRAADDLGRGDLGITRFKVRLNGVERVPVDQRRDRDGNHLIDGIHGLCLAALVELVAADIGRAGQDTMDRAHAPPPASAGVDFTLVEVFCDRLHAHAAGHAIALKGQLEHEPHGVSVEWVDFQLLFDLRAPLLSVHDAIADRR